MKYGVLKVSSQHINVGDIMQWEGLKYIYKRMGIPGEEIVEIDREFLKEYDGEYVLLPINGYFDNAFKINYFPISRKIIPVFIGIHAISEDVIERLRLYRDFGPFGCRDVETMKAMRRAGLDAYVSGCLSICREREVFSEVEERDKVYLIDVPEEAYEFIPEHILQNCVKLPSTFTYFSEEGYSENNTTEAKEYMNMLYTEMKNKAKFVITKRLHVSLPLMAMGIPVITLLPMDLMDCRFSGLNRILNCYTIADYPYIDWNPKALDIEELKEQTIQCAKNMIERAHDKYSTLCDLSGFYEQEPLPLCHIGVTASYVNETQKKEFMMRQGCWNYNNETNWLEFVTGKKLSQSHIIVYGAGDKGRWMLERYDHYFKQAASFHLVDSDCAKHGKKMIEIVNYVDWGQFNLASELIVENPEIIRKYSPNSLLIIVAANNYWSGAGLSIAQDLMKQYNLREGKEFFMLDKLNNSMMLGITEASRVNVWHEVL